MRILSKQEVQRAMDMTACIAANAEAFKAVSAGRARVPVKHVLPVDGQGEAVSLFMPGYLPDYRALGVKVVSVFPNNRSKGLANTIGAILMVSPDTGEPVGLMDGTWLTSLRTGAGTGVATRHMARPDATVLSLIGAGGMGFHQIEAVLAVRALKQVIIWNRTGERAVALAQEVTEFCHRSGRHVDVKVGTDQEMAVRAGDIVIASTASVEPVIFGAWIKPGTHVNLIGAHGANMREGDDELLLMSGVRAVDKFDSSAASGELRIPLEAGVVSRDHFVELGAIVAGEAPGRNSPEEITWFKSVGLAAQDMVCAAQIMERAEELELGTMAAL